MLCELWTGHGLVRPWAKMVTDWSATAYAAMVWTGNDLVWPWRGWSCSWFAMVWVFHVVVLPNTVLTLSSADHGRFFPSDGMSMGCVSIGLGWPLPRTAMRCFDHGLC